MKKPKERTLNELRQVKSYVHESSVVVNNFKEVKNPVFVRIETYSYKNKEIYNKYWEEIIKNMKKQYENFKIILISKSNPNKNEIKWYPYNEFSKEWENNHLEWGNIFLM